MATYNNQHWLLSHIRNSFISTDDTGMCETVMVSNDLPKIFLQNNQQQQTNTLEFDNLKSPRPPENNVRSSSIEYRKKKTIDEQETDKQQENKLANEFICYPGLDQSDDEDMDLGQSYDIQLVSEIGSHRLRTNTSAKLEKLDFIRRKAARTRNIKLDDTTVLPDNSKVLDELFQRREIPEVKLKIIENSDQDEDDEDDLVDGRADQESKPKSKLTELLMNCPKLPVNKFLHYARFDGTLQTGMPTRNLNIFLSMLPESQRNYPMRVCVLAYAKIEEVIGLICYRLTILYPEIQLQTTRHYGLYITEDNGEVLSDFPPLDLRQICQKFEFHYLTLAERRPSNQSGRALDCRTMSMTSETSETADSGSAEIFNISGQQQQSSNQMDLERMLDHNQKIEAPLYRTFRLQIIVNGFFKTEVQLGVSGERLEIDPVAPKNSKFWNRQKATSYNMESVAYCEIVEQKSQKAVLRIWYLNPYPMTQSQSSMHFYSDLTYTGGGPLNQSLLSSSKSSPQHFNSNYQSTASGNNSSNSFKYYDFETDPNTAQQILNKMNYILDVRSSVTRKEFLIYREKKKERTSKKSSSKS